jgi:hypothetical protein
MVPKTLSISAALIAVLAISSQSASAVEIRSTVAGDTGAKWIYTYTVTNSSIAAGISEFRVFFPVGDFDDLEVVGSPAGWDSIAIQPDPGIPDDGFFDSLLLDGAPIGVGESLGGFAVRFSFFGSGTPGNQRFEVLDPETFDVIASGESVMDTEPPVDVPEPGPAWLLTAGLMSLFLAVRNGPRRRRSRR